MTELSPAAQAVLDALIFLPFSDKAATMEGCAALQAAAALRAAAPMMECVQDHLKLLAIAAELDGTN
jgi:hypothetical protein